MKLCLAAVLSLAACGHAALPTVADLFSESYQEADAKFADACIALRNAELGVVMESYRNPGVQGPDGQSLYTRVCSFGDPDASTVLMTLSGVHGAEMFAPAAMQLRIMRERIVSAQDRMVLPLGVRAVFVHAVSPWGAAWGFKENEDNIDILKNLNGIYTVSRDHKQPSVVSALDAMNVKGLGTAMGFLGALQEFQTRAGSDATLMPGLSYGQNERKIGLAYYGTGPTWERTTAEAISRTFLAGYANIVVLDLHTAAGVYGDWFIAPYDPISDQRLAAWGAAAQAGAKIEPIYEAGVGMDPWPFFEYVKEMHPNSVVTRLVMEAGTFPQEQYQANLLMGVHCRYFGNINANEAGCETFFNTLHAPNPGAWTGPCCKFQVDRIREYFYPHLGSHNVWPALAHSNMSKPWQVIAHGLRELTAAAPLSQRRLEALIASSRGPAGLAGPAGSPGPMGPQGAAGQQGAQGAQGTPGDHGTAGSNGRDGGSEASWLPMVLVVVGLSAFGIVAVVAWKMVGKRRGASSSAHRDHISLVDVSKSSTTVDHISPLQRVA